MARFIQLQNSFASGELSEKMMARTDLDIAKNGAKLIENMEILPEGGVTKRNGFSIQYIDSIGAPFTPDFIGWEFIEFKTTDGKIFLIQIMLPVNPNASFTYILYSSVVDGVISENTQLGSPQNYPIGKPTDWIQLGDTLIITFSGSEPFIIYYSQGELGLVSYYNFINKSSSYLSCPMTYRGSIDSKISVNALNTSLGANRLFAWYNTVGTTYVPYPLFKVSQKSTYWGLHTKFALNHSSSTTDYLFKTSFHDINIDGNSVPRLVGTIQANLYDIVASSSSGLTSGCRMKYTSNGMERYGFLRLITGSTWHLVESFDQTWSSPYTAISFQVAGAITLTAMELTEVPANTEFPALASAKTNSYSEAIFSTSFGFPTTVGMVDGRLVFSGVEGFSNMLFASSVYNLFYLNPVKLRQDDQTYYKVNTKASDISGLNYFGSSSQDDPKQLSISSSSVNSVKWIKSVGKFTVVGTESDESILSLDYSGTDVVAKTTAVSSFGSLNTNAVSSSGNTYFISKYNELIQLVPNVDEGVKAGNISALNSTIIDFLVDSLIFDDRKQCLYILPKGENKIIGYSISKLTGVSGFFRYVIAPPPIGTHFLNGGCMLNGELLFVFHGVVNGAYDKLGFMRKNSTYTDYVSTPFTARVELLPYDFGNPYGTALTTMRRLHSIGVKLYKTSACSIGSSITNMEDLILDSLEFTGEKLVNFPASPDTSPRVIFESSADLPLTILGVVFKGEAFE